MPPGGETRAQDLRRWRRCHDRRRARRISRRERQAGHRKPARLHQEGPSASTTPASTISSRWKAAERKQAIIDELEAEGLPLDPLAEEVGKDLDPFDLICQSPSTSRRSPAANAPTRSASAMCSPSTAAGPRRARSAAEKYQDEGVHQPRRSQHPADPAVRRDGHPARAHQGSSAARADFEHAVHELQAALYQEAA